MLNLGLAEAFMAARRNRPPADPNLIDVSEAARGVGISRRTMMTRELFDAMRPRGDSTAPLHETNRRQALRVALFALNRAKRDGLSRGDSFTVAVVDGRGGARDRILPTRQVDGWVKVDERSGAAILSLYRRPAHG